MARWVFFLFLASWCCLATGCSSVSASAGSVISAARGVFGERTEKPESSGEKAQVCMLTPTPEVQALVAEGTSSGGIQGSCIQVPQTAHDFGQIQGEVDLTHDFKVVNRCETKVKIKSVRPG